MRSHAEEVTITDEVVMDANVKYLIRIGGEEVAFVDTEKDAKLVVDSIASSEQKRLKDDWIKVFREDVEDGKKVTISIQPLGRFFNGSVQEYTVVDMIPIGHATIVKNDEEGEKYDIGVPIPEILKRLYRLKEDLDLKRSIIIDEDKGDEGYQTDDDSESESSTISDTTDDIYEPISSDSDDEELVLSYGED